MTALLAYWGEETHLLLLQKIINRSTDPFLDLQNGSVLLNEFRWYPLLLIQYYSGVAAIANKNFSALNIIFNTKLNESNRGRENETLSSKLLSTKSEIFRIFKQMPDRERQHTPISEYLLSLLQPDLDNLFFLGKNYEYSFDYFELLNSLTILDASLLENPSWPIVSTGRFAWKFKSFLHHKTQS